MVIQVSSVYSKNNNNNFNKIIQSTRYSILWKPISAKTRYILQLMKCVSREKRCIFQVQRCIFQLARCIIPIWRPPGTKWRPPDISGGRQLENEMYISSKKMYILTGEMYISSTSHKLKYTSFT